MKLKSCHSYTQTQRRKEENTKISFEKLKKYRLIPYLFKNISWHLLSRGAVDKNQIGYYIYIIKNVSLIVCGRGEVTQKERVEPWNDGGIDPSCI